MNVTLAQASYLPIIPAISSLISSPFFPWIMDSIGRKNAMLLVSIPYIIAWILVMFAESIYVLYLSRFAIGLADAALFTVLPTYVSEIATPSVRGSWGNTPTIMISVGLIVVNTVGGYFDIKTTAYILVWVQVLFTVTFWCMPETPYYLLMKGRNEEAEATLRKLRRKKNVEDEFKQLSSDVSRQTSESGKLSDLFTNSTNRKALCAGAFIRAAQQFSGISAFNTFTAFIFQQSGSEMSRTVSSIIFSTILLVMSIISAFFMNKLGRKWAMIISCGGSSIVLVPTAIYFYLQHYSSLDVSQFSFVPLIALLLYLVFYSIGMALVPSLIIGELFSTSIKAKGITVLNIGFCIFEAVSLKLFHILVDSIGIYSPFILFSMCCIVSCAASFYLVPETKGKTLEEIQQSLKKDKSTKKVEGIL